MELLVFAIVVFVLAIFWMWRVRRVGTDDDYGTDRQGTLADHDLASTRGFGMKHEPLNTRVPRPDRVSRESGHGKDGGG